MSQTLCRQTFVHPRRGVSGAFNIGSGTGISINALVEELKSASGPSPNIVHGPHPDRAMYATVWQISVQQATSLQFAPNVG